MNVAGARFELLAIHRPEPASFSHELDFVVRMPVRPGPAPGERAQEEDGDVHVAMVGPNEFVRAAPKGQILLADAVHGRALLGDGTGIDTC